MNHYKYYIAFSIVIFLQSNVFAQWAIPDNIIGEVDAVAFSSSENSIVFFSANAIQYYTLDDSDLEAAFVLAGIDNMPSEIKGIDAAVAWDSEHLLLFTNQHYLLYNLPNSMIIETNTWTGLPIAWEGKLDAVCHWEEESFIFFYANEYIVYDRENNSYSEVGVIKNWEGWPADWDNFSAVVNIGNGILYFFKDNQYLSYDIETQIFEGPF